MNDIDEIALARKVLREWFRDRGEEAIASTVETWDGASGPAACSFVPGAGRSNRIFLVKGDRVFDFAPSEMGFAEAIRRLNDQP